MGPSGRITHVIGYIGYILHILDCLGYDMQVLYKYCFWVELPVQRRLCPIFMKNVGSPDIHEYSAG